MARKVKQIVFNTEKEIDSKMWDFACGENFSWWVKERIREEIQPQPVLNQAVISEEDIERIIRKVISEKELKTGEKVVDTPECKSDIKRGMSSFLKR